MGKENLTAHYQSLHFWLNQHSLAVGFGTEFSHIFISLEEMRSYCFGSLELKCQRTERFWLSWTEASAGCPHEPLGATAVHSCGAWQARREVLGTGLQPHTTGYADSGRSSLTSLKGFAISWIGIFLSGCIYPMEIHFQSLPWYRILWIFKEPHSFAVSINVWGTGKLRVESLGKQLLQRFKKIYKKISDLHIETYVTVPQYLILHMAPCSTRSLLTPQAFDSLLLAPAEDLELPFPGTFGPHTAQHQAPCPVSPQEA